MLTHTLGFPRIGVMRELKKAVEAFWKKTAANDGVSSAEDIVLFEKQALIIRRANWIMQGQNGIDLVPAGDFSLYDHILDMTCALGAIPERFGYKGGDIDLATYFRMARGGHDNDTTTPMEMTKWYDTNYHYIVPEFHPDETFPVTGHAAIKHFEEAAALGLNVKAVLPGPLTYLSLGKSILSGFDKWDLLSSLTTAYADIVADCAKHCQWIQLDEPVLVTDCPPEHEQRFRDVYSVLKDAAGKARLMIATYFGDVRPNLGIIAGLPVDCLHIDLVRCREQARDVIPALPADMCLSLGVVDGRNIWRADIQRAVSIVDECTALIGSDRIMIAPSCSLLHVPVDLDAETDMNQELRASMAFAVQKCREVRLIADTVSSFGHRTEAVIGPHGVDHSRWNDSAVRNRIGVMTESMYKRPAPYAERRRKQREKLDLPILPTTTIGSFPQTDEIRKARKHYADGQLSQTEYEQTIRRYIACCIAMQEKTGLDVLVHGEPERNDMVQYFGEMLDGFLITQNGWVQSYGTRCVKPPVIYGDVTRRAPMTVPWIVYAQSLTAKPVKGMLTGPVTILAWSFVRDDQPREKTCLQIALAIRDETLDLEKGGISVIQIDEPAFREIAPLRATERTGYYEWAARCFRLASSGVADATQIHTHMCYSEFNEIVREIISLEADVISIEASRSNMELLHAFRKHEYPYDIGPGIYDIHSPRIPSVAEMTGLLEKALECIHPESLWANPDCGLKTRTWQEVEPSLAAMVDSARTVRRRILDS